MANNPYFDAILSILKAYYTKTNKNIFFKDYIFVIMRWLSTDMREQILKAVKVADSYMNYIKDHHVSILLYFLIPKISCPTRFNFIKIEEPEREELHEKIRKCLKYSYKEYNYIKHLLDLKININREYWYKSFAIKERAQQ